MNKQALFCDGSKWYVSPQEPGKNEEVTFKFRTARQDAVRVSLWVEETEYVLRKTKEDYIFDYYEVRVVIGEEPFSYFFLIQDKDELVYYKKEGVCGKEEGTPFYICPGFSTPDWMKGAVLYQIFTDRFCNGNPSTDVKAREYYYAGGYVQHVSDWNKPPSAVGFREFYGGDLQGVLDKLDYLQDLGVEVIYFNPIFVSPSNHKYDTQDYDYIDPHFTVIKHDGGRVLHSGEKDNRLASRYQRRVANIENLEASNEFFVTFMDEVHNRGMKVILDGVFNHCGSFHKWMDREGIYECKEGFLKGAYHTRTSSYHNHFKFESNDENSWPDNKTYEGWWGFDTLPKLNYEASKELENDILEIGKKWVSAPFYADGWRLDVAADLGHSTEYNHEFWKKFRRAVKEANPEAVILAEHYGDPQSWLMGDEWDTIMNYDAFMEPLTWYLTGMEKHSDQFVEQNLGNSSNFVNTMRYHRAKFMPGSLEVAMNELSNHDHSRFLTRTNGVVGRVADLGYKAAEEGVRLEIMRIAVLMQMTWPGAPTIYYGDEAGVCGFTDPDNRRTYPWEKENQELINFHKEAIALHKESEALRRGSLKVLANKEGALSYGRFTDDEKLLVIVNRDETETFLEIPVWEIGMKDKVKLCTLAMTDRDGFEKKELVYYMEQGILKIKIPAVSAVVLAEK